VNRAGALLALLTAAAGCASEPGPPEWLVDGPRVIAVIAEPPEVAPTFPTTLQAIAAGPEGPIDASAARWLQCAQPAALTDPGGIAASCLDDGQPTLGAGDILITRMRADACSLFGPVTTSSEARPRDPDATGGYYLPVRVQLEAAMTFAQVRIRCPLPRATLAVAQELDERYRNNANPGALRLTAWSGDAAVSLDAAPAGAPLRLRAEWPEGADEVFPVLDPETQQLRDVREALFVSWYASGGALDRARTAPLDGANAAEVGFRVPASGTAWIWAVLRDSRGGAAVATARVTAEAR
jgi:hypothetical protein